MFFFFIVSVQFVKFVLNDTTSINRDLFYSSRVLNKQSLRLTFYVAVTVRNPNNNNNKTFTFIENEYKYGFRYRI